MDNKMNEVQTLIVSNKITIATCSHIDSNKKKSMLLQTKPISDEAEKRDMFAKKNWRDSKPHFMQSKSVPVDPVKEWMCFNLQWKSKP